MTYKQSQKRLQIMRDLRQVYKSDYLNKKQTAQHFGHPDPRRAQSIFDELPACRFGDGKRVKYYIGDIAEYGVLHSDFKG